MSATILPGALVIYVPNHAHGWLGHKDCERGFVTAISIGRQCAWCRFWSKYDPAELRTRANSERCDYDNLVVVGKMAPVRMRAMEAEYGFKFYEDGDSLEAVASETEREV